MNARNKPDRPTAMKNLIREVRMALPFEQPEANICSGPCEGCSLKLLEFLDTELESWEFKLKAGEIPSLGEISRLAKTSQKIYRVLEKNELVSKSSVAD